MDHSPSDGIGSSAPSTQSPGKGRGNFDVFLSFRGPDVRFSFLSHLWYVLDCEGIHAYVDSEDLRRGEYITFSLKKAIWNSAIAIVILSENYASSSWCLDELAEIMDRWKQGNLAVKPVFYRVDPKEVRTPRGSYSGALSGHELKVGKDSAKLRRWREALFEAGNLSGYHVDANRNEAELLQEIVKDITAILDPTHLYVAKYPVGIEYRVGQIKNLLNVESDVVLLIGLWGMAGVGKTTLAKAIINSLVDQFVGCAFLSNVREDAVNPSVGLAKLQEKLLSEVLRRKDVTVGSIASGITLIKNKLCQKKVLLLLDDVSSVEQLDALAGGLDWFGDGSRILVTTRDRSILMAHNRHIIHKVEGLPHNQALQLFQRHAFLENDRPSIATDLVDRCLTYCDGLPLGLVVLGSFLRNREEHHWRSTLKLLEQQGPCKEIDKAFRISLEELDHNAREIFLAIACIFKGKSIRDIENAMDARGFQTSLGIEMLVERSLITIVEDTTCGLGVERVGMHPMLQLMGQNIARCKSPDEAGKHNRAWVCQDAYSGPSRGMITNTVKRLATRSCCGLRWNTLSRYSASNTLFIQPRKLKVGVSICSRGISHRSLRVGLDDFSWHNHKLTCSVANAGSGFLGR